MNNRDLIKEFFENLFHKDKAIYELMVTIEDAFKLSDFEHAEYVELCIIADLCREAQEYVENELYKKFGDYEEADDEICEYELSMWSKWLSSNSEIEFYGKE